MKARKVPATLWVMSEDQDVLGPVEQARVLLLAVLNLDEPRAVMTDCDYDIHNAMQLRWPGEVDAGAIALHHTSFLEDYGATLTFGPVHCEIEVPTTCTYAQLASLLRAALAAARGDVAAEGLR